MKIGNVELKNKVVLAPMAGISNPAFMKVCEEMGCGYAVTELISAEAIVRDNKKTFDMLKGIDKLNIPVAIQIFGSNEESMAKAAKIITDLYDNVFIDINMGCPVPKVANRAGAGSALLKSPDKVRSIVSSVVDAVKVPVTVKIRSGWDSNSINAPLIAKICEEAGASAIAVHPRTRAQGYSGKADWSIIKLVKESVSIPVIGNGDIKNKYDALRMLNETGCDAVMIGRGVLGNPWLILDTVNYLSGKDSVLSITYEDRINMIIKHLNYLLETKPEKVAVCEMRMHIAHYLKGMPNIGAVKQAIFKTYSADEVIRILNDYLKSVG